MMKVLPPRKGRDIVSNLRRAALAPTHYSAAETKRLFNEAADEIEVLQEALAEALAPERDDPEGRA